jgi:hypothetical protein
LPATKPQKGVHRGRPHFSLIGKAHCSDLAERQTALAAF